MSTTRFLIVPGLAIWENGDWHGLEKEKGFSEDSEVMNVMTKSIERQVQQACESVRSGSYDVVAFSGGRTRKELADRIKNSEADGMYEFAKEKDWLGEFPAIRETFARDSHENILYSMLAFRKAFGSWPGPVAVVGHAHKALRFQLMSIGLKIPDFTFHGIGAVKPLDRNCVREIKNLADIVPSSSDEIEDPLLRGPRFQEKRRKRTLDQFHDEDDYLRHVKNAYENDKLIDQLVSCAPTKESWQRLDWPWNT